MAVRELRVFEDPDLQQPCRTVDAVNDHVRMLLEDLADTMTATKGCIALAANQVGIKRRLAVIATDKGVQKLVNPKIAGKSGLQEIVEDCICFKDIEGYMLRPESVIIEALDENGSQITIEAWGEEASVYCHVIDHLDGKILVKEVLRFVNKPLEGEE